MIPTILDESDSDLVMGLADVIYFDSEWEDPYEDEDTSKRKFYNSDRSTSDVTYLNTRLFDHEDKKNRDDDADRFSLRSGSLFSSQDDLKKRRAEEDKEWDHLIDLDILGFFDDDEEK